jgi:protein TonB
MNWSIYQKRETTAQLGTAVIALLVLAMSQSWSMHQDVVVQDNSISLSLMTPSAITEQPIQPPQPQKIVEQHAEVIPESEMPTQVQEKVVEQATPTPPVEAVVAQPHPVNANADATYVAKVRSYLFSIKRYPTSREARLQRPVGQVELWFVLERNGRMMDAGIEHSSHSLILDSAALSTVRGGSYPSFPEEVWAGETSHRFTVVLEYLI